MLECHALNMLYMSCMRTLLYALQTAVVFSNTEVRSGLKQRKPMQALRVALCIPRAALQ